MKDSHELQSIDIESGVDSLVDVSLSELGADIKYIKKEKSIPLLRGVYEADFAKEFFVVSDRSLCYLYDYNGHLLSQISSKGKGPGEYGVVSNLAFDSSGNILIDDINSIRIYDSTGKYIKTIKPEDQKFRLGGSWALLNDSLFIIKVRNTSKTDSIKTGIFNINGETVRQFKNYIEEEGRVYSSALSMNASIYSFDGKVFYKEFIDDTLFVLRNMQELAPRIIFHTGKYGQPKIEMFSPEGQERMFEYVFPQYVYETHKYILVKCQGRNFTQTKRSTPKEIAPGRYSEYFASLILGLYIKTNKEFCMIRPRSTDNRLVSTGIFNDLDGGPSFLPTYQINDSTLGMFINAADLITYVQSKEFVESSVPDTRRKAQFASFVNDLSENDNPVLMIVTFRR